MPVLVNSPWLLAVALLILVIGIVGWIRRLGSPSILLHAVVAALLLVALAEPHTDTTSPVGSVTALVDISHSMPAQLSRELFNQLGKYRSAGVTVQIKPFSGKPAAFTTGENDVDALRRTFSGLDLDATNFSQALQSSNEEPAVLLLSDGNGNRGGEVTDLRNKIYPLVVPGIGESDALELKPIIAPLRAPKEAKLPVRVSVKNHSNKDRSGKLTVTLGKIVLNTETLSIKAGEERVLDLKADIIGDDIQTISARLEQSGNPVEEQKAYVTPALRDTIVMLSGTDEDQRYLKKVLEDESFELKTAVGPVGNEILADIGKAKAIILNNISIESLGGEEHARTIANAVKQGAGLVTVGGPKSYGLGGYRGSAIEQVLAVVPLPPQQKEKRLNVAVELVIDKSRSMADDDRLESAKEAAREVIRNLKDDDFIGVIGFDSTPFEVIRLGQVGQVREQALRRVENLFARGNTNLFPSLEEARRRLEVAPAARKHMIVLTDGKLPDADESYKVLIRGMRLLGITLSTVLLSGENDFGFLEELANIGGGTFYQTSNASNLPKIFMQDIRVRSGEQTLKEQQNYVVRRTSEAQTITALADFPVLRGYVDSAPRNDSHVELMLKDGDDTKPLLAERAVGSGRSIAYLSDANGRWSNFWVGWNDFRRFWFDVVQRASRPSENKGGKLKYEIESSLLNGEQTLWLTTYGGVPTRLPELSLTYEDGKQQRVTMSSEAKGRYAVNFAPLSPGRLTIKPSIDGADYQGVSIFVDPAKLTDRVGAGVNIEYLSGLASKSGGVINPDARLLLGNEKHESRFLVRPFLNAAILLYLASLLLRAVLVRKK